MPLASLSRSQLCSRIAALSSYKRNSTSQNHTSTRSVKLLAPPTHILDRPRSSSATTLWYASQRSKRVLPHIPPSHTKPALAASPCTFVTSVSKPWLPLAVGATHATLASVAITSSPSLTHKALLLDAAGTLFEPSEPVTQVYLDIGSKYGVTLSADEILYRYRVAYSKPWSRSILRYVEDGKPFWSYILAEATNCHNPAFAEEVYAYYSSGTAWRLIDPQARDVLRALKAAGVKLAVVSNFDTRLRPILQSLNCLSCFDAVAVSAEVEAEKPNPTIFLKACELLHVEPADAVHVGDDRRNDVWGARSAGCDALLWGEDVASFADIARHLGVECGQTAAQLAS